MNKIDEEIKNIVTEKNTHLEHMCTLDFQKPTMYRRLTGIVCTIGKASRHLGLLYDMMKSGMNICRLNFSYESHEAHGESMQLIREACRILSQELGYNRQVAIALDMKGAEIRTGLLETNNANNEVELKKGENIRLSINPDLMDKGTRECVYIDYANIINVVQPGNKVFINGGEIVLLIKEVSVDQLMCTIEIGGMLGSRKVVILPNVQVDLPAISEKDRYDLKFGMDRGVDMIFASGIRTAGGLKEIRNTLGEKGKDIMIIAKFENLQSLHQLDEIIDAADGILVARGDLGVELSVEKVFLVQKAIVARCNKVGKPVIVATQLLESMRYKSRPTRAEVADLGNAVLDGADCVMLASETAIGDNVLKAVDTLASICRESEAVLWHQNFFNELLARKPAQIDAAHAIAIGAVEAAKNCLATAIVVLTVSGRSAFLVSKYQPKCPIFSVTRCSRAARQGHLYRCIVPLLYLEPANPDYIQDVEARIRYALVVARKMHFVKLGDAIVVLSPWKDAPGFTNNMRIIYAFYENESFECTLKRDTLHSNKLPAK